MRKLNYIIFRIGAFLLLYMMISASVNAESTKSDKWGYNGTYMGRIVISKYMANFCEIPDDVIVGKVDLLKNCMDKLAGNMRDENAQKAEEGKEDWRRVLGDTWNMALTTAATILDNRQNYYDEYNTLWQSTEQTNNQNLDQSASSNASEKQMKPFLSLLAMYAEQLKATAINNLPNVDPKILYVLPASGQKDNIEYKGVFEDIQIVPNALSIYCELDGENFIYEEKKEDVKKCLDTLLAKLNAKEAGERKQAKEDFSVILAEQAQHMMLQAVNKSAGNVEYEKARNMQAESNAQVQTDFEAMTSVAFVDSLQLQGINDFRSFYGSGMKFLALSNLTQVDVAAVIDDISNDVDKEIKEEDYDAENQVEKVSVTVKEGEHEEVDSDLEDEAAAQIGDSGDGSSDGNNEEGEMSNDEMVEQGSEAAQAKAEAAKNKASGDNNKEYDEDEIYLGNGKCKINGQTVHCPDGVYQDSTGKPMYCLGGKCIEIEQN